jgi:hypothetical protein
MEIRTIAHKVLKKGDILRSPNGDRDWVVITPATTGDTTIKIASINRYMNKSEKELEEWLIKIE